MLKHEYSSIQKALDEHLQKVTSATLLTLKGNRTPKEIKKGLMCRILSYKEKCDRKCEVCELYIPHYNIKYRYEDALYYIQQLESRLAQVERERDALLNYLADPIYVHCSICKHNDGSGVSGCKRVREMHMCFEWRGVCEENTKEDTYGS